MKGLRGLLVLAVALLVGCGGHQTLEELEIAAIESGDWSAVDRRERAMARRKAAAGTACGQGMTAVCQRRSRSSPCECVSGQSFDHLLGNL